MGRRLAVVPGEPSGCIKCHAIGTTPSLIPGHPMIRFGCSCGAKLKASPDKVGQEVGCPSCLARLIVPAPERRPASEVDLAEIDEEPERPVRRRTRREGNDERTRREPRRSEDDSDDGVPIRTRGRDRGRNSQELGPKIVRRVLIASLISLAVSCPLGCFVSQFTPMFGGWITAIAEPFSPARMQSAPTHVIAFAGIGLFLTSAITAAVVYLSHADRS